MTNELRKLIQFIILLSIIGSILSFVILTSSLIFIINFIAEICTLAWAIVLFSIMVIFVFILLIVTISKPLSKLEVYVEPKNPLKGFKEPITSNLIEVFKNNVILTIPLYFTIVYLLNPANFFVVSGSPVVQSDMINEFKAAIVIIPGYLLSIRLLTNSVKSGCNLILIGPLLSLIRDYYSDNNSIELLKERIVSFYFSLTASTFIVMVMLGLYRAIPLGGTLPSLSDPLNLIFWGRVFQIFEVSFIPHFDSNVIQNSTYILLFLGAYFVSLFILTVAGEIILEHYVVKGSEVSHDS
jgi:hypothetical protein